MKKIVEPLLLWYDRNARKLPWRETRDPYRIWISEIMLQQTRVEAVISHYRRFLAELPDAEALASVPEERLLKLWEGLGYYSRARNLKRAAQIIIKDLNGQFPEAPETLKKLPGIGAYSAGAIASIAFGVPEPAVDGNVLRVYSRLHADSSPVGDPRFRARVAAELRAVYPAERCGDFTQSLMELGATVCLPNGAPHCTACPLAEFCRGRERAQEFPVKAAKTARKIAERTILLWCSGERIGVRKRPAAGLLANLWEFPGEERVLSMAELEKQFPDAQIIPSVRARHIFSHIEWVMYGFLLITNELPSDLQMVSLEELTQKISLPSAFRPFLTAWKEYLKK